MHFKKIEDGLIEVVKTISVGGVVDMNFGFLEKDDDSLYFYAIVEAPLTINADEMRAIADKLDELNKECEG